MSVIFVPLISSFMGQNLNKNTKIGVLGVISGLYLLCGESSESGFSINDFGILLSALFFAIQIIIAGQYAPRTDAIKISCIQLATAGTLSVPLILLNGVPNLQTMHNSLFSLIYLGIFVSGGAYTLQLYGQKSVNPVLTSMILSAETIFALMGGCSILGEAVTSNELCGCILIFGAIIISQLKNLPSPLKQFSFAYQPRSRESTRNSDV